MATGPGAVLVMRSDVVGGSMFPLRTTDRCVNGRSSTRDIVIDLPQVSRRHAEIIYHDEAYFASDLESSNGTLANGERLRPGNKMALSHGDLLSLQLAPGDTPSEKVRGQSVDMRTKCKSPR